MTSFRFVSNLRAGTVSAFEGSQHTPAAWLLSSHRLTRVTEGLALDARSRGLEVFADNGTKPLIDSIVRRFWERTEPLREDIQRLRRGLGNGRRMPRRAEVPEVLRRRAAAMAREVENAVEAELDAENVLSVTSRQLRMNPTALFVKEDFTAPCLIALGLEREITGWPVDHFRDLCERTIGWHEEVATDPRLGGVDLYATLPAVDYSTARASAMMAAQAGIDSVAIGFAGINLDRSFVDVAKVPHAIRLPSAAPRRYVRTAEVLLGLRDGYRETESRLRRLHALGMGALAMYPITGACLDWYTHVTVDATSPIHDAVNDLVFYDHEAFGDRVTVVEAAERVLGGGTWAFECPFCLYLRDRFGHDVDGAIRWWKSGGQPGIEREMLHPSQPLGTALGVFASARDGSAPVQARGRIGHNHWACESIATSIPSSGRAKWCRKAMDDIARQASGGVSLGVASASQVVDVVNSRARN